MNRFDFDSLGDRMKRYEDVYDSIILPGAPVVVRLDGRSFHTYTKSFNRPFDETFHVGMVKTVKELVREFNPNIAYTQSDEISLGFCTSDVPFSGRIQKICSVFSGFASSVFNTSMRNTSPSNPYACFDARVISFPNKEEFYQHFVWRQADAARNSVSMAAHSMFSPKELHKKSRSDMHEMMFKAGVNWNNYPVHFRRGTFVQKSIVPSFLSQEELMAIPEKHRPPYQTTFLRTRVVEFDPGILTECDDVGKALYL